MTGTDDGDDEPISGAGGEPDDVPNGADPHGDRPVVAAGAPLAAAEVVAVLLHGRGATARGVVALADGFYRHGVAFVAPQAARSRWYPYSFAAPLDRNEPHLTSAVGAVEDVIGDLRERGVPLDRVILCGVSQGGCLAAEVAARRPRRYGGVAILSGALMGPDVNERRFEGSFDGAPVVVSGGAADGRVPPERIRETAAAFRRLDADVRVRIGDRGHAIDDEDLALVDSLIGDVLEPSTE